MLLLYCFRVIRLRQQQGSHSNVKSKTLVDYKHIKSTRLLFIYSEERKELEQGSRINDVYPEDIPHKKKFKTIEVANIMPFSVSDQTTLFTGNKIIFNCLVKLTCLYLI